MQSFERERAGQGSRHGNDGAKPQGPYCSHEHLARGLLGHFLVSSVKVSKKQSKTDRKLTQNRHWVNGVSRGGCQAVFKPGCIQIPWNPDVMESGYSPVKMLEIICYQRYNRPHLRTTSLPIANKTGPLQDLDTAFTSRRGGVCG